MIQDPDIKLAEAFRSGDQQAFQKVFNRFYRPIYFFANKLIKNNAEAEDIAIGTFSKIWKIHMNFDTIINIKAFLYITTRNQCLNYLEKLKRDHRNRHEHEYLLKNTSDEHVLFSMIQDEVYELIRSELNSLSPQRRQILQMSFFENLSTNEIAKRMNLSIHTVRNTKTQGIQQLREKLAEKKMLIFMLLFALSMLTN